MSTKNIFTIFAHAFFILFSSFILLYDLSNVAFIFLISPSFILLNIIPLIYLSLFSYLKNKNKMSNGLNLGCIIFKFKK